MAHAGHVLAAGADGRLGSAAQLARRARPLDVWLALPFFAGLALALWRMRRPAYSIVLIGWIGLLLPGMVSSTRPTSTAFWAGPHPPPLLIGMGLDWLWGRATLRRWRLHWLVPALLVLSPGHHKRDCRALGRAARPTTPSTRASGRSASGVGRTRRARPATSPPRGEEHSTLAFAWRTLPADARPVTYDGRRIFPLTARPRSAGPRVLPSSTDTAHACCCPRSSRAATVIREFVGATGTVYAHVCAPARQCAPTCLRNPRRLNWATASRRRLRSSADTSPGRDRVRTTALAGRHATHAGVDGLCPPGRPRWDGDARAKARRPATAACPRPIGKRAGACSMNTRWRYPRTCRRTTTRCAARSVRGGWQPPPQR
ncbi:MAG: hypothetical protein R3A10_15630 [Caldilineaceae bacterium]